MVAERIDKANIFVMIRCPAEGKYLDLSTVGDLNTEVMVVLNKK